MGCIRNRIPIPTPRIRVPHKVLNKRDFCEVFLLNVRGINNKVLSQKLKLKEIADIVNQSDVNIPFFILTETHLKDHFDAEVDIENYNQIRADRDKRRQGGVIIYSHKSFCLEDHECFSNQYCELALPITEKMIL